MEQLKKTRETLKKTMEKFERHETQERKGGRKEEGRKQGMKEDMR